MIIHNKNMVQGSNALSFTSQAPYEYDTKKGVGALKKSKEKKNIEPRFTIVHKMADGTIRDSVKDYEIPYNQMTAVVYDLLAKETSYMTATN